MTADRLASDVPLVGIVGAAGAVGRHVCRLLACEPHVRLRLGGRRADAMRALVAEMPADRAELRAIDIADPRALADFCDGCRVVVGCTGPSFRILDTIARAAFAAGAEYVDPGGDHPLFERLVQPDVDPRRTALLTAGMMPGLSALLLRWIAQRAGGRPSRLTAYVGGRGRMTPGTAADYVLSLDVELGEPHAAWHNGARASRRLTTLTDADVPFFPRRVTAQPFISTEFERVARRLALREAEWYNVFDGPHLLAALRRIRQGAPGKDLTTHVAELSEAAALDLFGESAYQLFVFTLEAETPTGTVTRTHVLRAHDAQTVTGAVTAAAVLEVVNGEVGPGICYAGDVLSVSVVDWLATASGVVSLETFDALDASDARTEGAIV